MYGHVQGVGYRYFTQRAATAHRLTGWVANRRDGSVEVWAEGPPTELEEFVKLLWAGPAYARVERVVREAIAPHGGYTNFFVRRGE